MSYIRIYARAALRPLCSELWGFDRMCELDLGEFPDWSPEVGEVLLAS